MDTKDVAAILLKTMGSVMLAYAVFRIPWYFPPHVRTIEQYNISGALADAAATLSLPIVIGLLLWFMCGRLAAIFTTADNGRLRGHAGASLGSGLAVAVNKVLKRRGVAEWLRRGPVVRTSWWPTLAPDAFVANIPTA